MGKQWLLLLAASGILPINALAQDSLKISGVEVYGEYRPSIADAEKKNLYPDATRPVPPKRDYQYNTTSFVMLPEPALRLPEARKFGDTLMSKVRGNYVRLGFGNFITPLVELYLHNSRNKKMAYGLSVNHRSSDGPELANFGRTSVNTYGERYLKSGTLYGNAGYEMKRFRFYGADKENAAYNEDSTKISYNLITAGAGFRSRIKGKNMQWGLGAKYHFFQNQNEHRENDIEVSGLVLFPFKNGHFEIPVSFNPTTYEAGGFKLSRNILKIRPVFTFNWKKFEFQGGLNIVNVGIKHEGLIREQNPFFNDTVGKFRVFPVIKASFELDPKTIYLDLALQGDVQVNTFRRFANINPYLVTPVNLNNTRQQYDLQIMLRGRLSSRTTIRGGVHAQGLANIPLYMTDSGMLRGFHVLSDDASVIGFEIEGQYQWGEKLQLLGTGTFNSYNMKNQASPWQLPTAIVSLHGRYDIARKIIADIGVTYFNSRQTNVVYTSGAERKLDAVTDLGLKLEYRWKSNISAFVEFSNMISKRYELWRNYPALGFQGMAGVTFSL